ncbi:MAG: cell division protein ZapA [Oscillospiraceae bacterium]|nr:cell division protein ZapA [Oscillospiraceae bacterium]MBQ5989521.1 cell division protein ZapA [Oscillospiraceae bacterium]MBR6924440.1 cell division protein ZapA [Oscillospiraceae bacterium]
MNRVKVVICGKEYTIRTDEEPTYVYNLARKLEKNIAELVGVNVNQSVYSASVMIALSTLDEMNRCNEDNDNLRLQLKDYADEASRARLERDSALREVELLKNRIAELEKKSGK